jgi:hypothetical protein
MAKKLVAMVEPDGVGALQPAHSGHQVAPGSFHHQMVMIVHQAVGVDLETGLLAGFGQSLEKILTIHVIQENRLAPVSPAHDVVDGSGIFNARLVRHDQIQPPAWEIVNSKV